MGQIHTPPPHSLFPPPCCQGALVGSSSPLMMGEHQPDLVMAVEVETRRHQPAIHWGGPWGAPQPEQQSQDVPCSRSPEGEMDSGVQTNDMPVTWVLKDPLSGVRFVDPIHSPHPTCMARWRLAMPSRGHCGCLQEPTNQGGVCPHQPEHGPQRGGALATPHTPPGLQSWAG